MDMVRVKSGVMPAERSAAPSFWNIKNIFVLGLCFLIASSVGLVTAAQIGIDSTSGVMDRVTVGGTLVSGNSYDEVLASVRLIADKMTGQPVVLTGKDGEEYRTSAKELGVVIDAEAMAKEAYGICRYGNILENVSNYWRLRLLPRDIAPAVYIQEPVLDNLLNELDKKISVEKINADYKTSAKEITLLAGSDGVTLHKAESKQALIAALKQVGHPDVKDQVISVNLLITDDKAEKLDIDSLAASLYKEAKDAAWIKDQSGNLTLQPHTDGVRLDVDLARAKLGQAGKNPVVMPLAVIKPERTTELLQANLFSDVLATYTTTLANNPDRTHNVNQAAQRINGLVLTPGEVFSFNKIVGPRTYETGFKDAKIYVKDEIVDGVGGGICQVTSTLYMTTLMADLKTVERKNHRFTVAYIPLGYDATVAYGAIDFQFSNNQDYPIKVEAFVKGDKLTVTLLGTNAHPGRTVELTTKTYNQKPYGVKQKPGANLAAGTTRIEQKGTTGYTVDTYRVVKEGDTVLRSEKIHTSVYTPCDEIVLVGPALPENPADPAEPVDPSAPQGPFGPVDPTVPVDPAVPADPTVPQEPETPPTTPPALDPSYIIDPWLIA